MSDLQTLIAIERGQLILAVDDLRAVDDLFKLSTSLRAVVVARLADLLAKTAAAALAEGDRTGASLACRMALRHLESSHRFGYRYIEGLLPDWVPVVTGTGPYISNAERTQQWVRYGFASGMVGEFTDGRLEDMARLVPVAAAATVGNAAWHYPGDLQEYIAAQLAALEANQPLATGGSRQAAIAARNAARELMEDANSRVRGFYISASDEGDRTHELAKINYQPRRPYGEATDPPAIGVPLLPFHDAAAKTLEVQAMPENATTLRAYVRIVGGSPQIAGVSLGRKVSLVQLNPLLPGTDYEAWVAGAEGDREGPPSPSVTFTTAA